jgi:hypothetical protein
MKSNWKVWVAVLATAFSASAAQAALISSPGQLSPTFVIGFDTNTGSGITTPTEVGGGTGYSVSFTPAGGPGSVGLAPSGTWLLEPAIGAGNGTWGDGKTFAGVDGGVEPIIASMTFTLNGFTAFAIGGFLNFDPTFTFGLGSPLPLYIAALDANGDVIEDQELPIFTPDGFNAGAFYGFRFDDPVIAAFYIEGPYAVIDDLAVQAVPEPSTYALLAAGLAMLAFMMRRNVRG